MTVSSTEIERIVREVLAELAGAGADGASVPPSFPKAGRDNGQGTATSPPAAPGELALTAPVVTLADLEGRLGALRRLVVPTGAVVTPAVRDELRRRNVALLRSSDVPSRPSGDVRLVAVTHGERSNSSAVLAAINQEGVPVEAEAADCLIVATDRLAEAVADSDALGLLLTRHTAAGLCLANRHAGVRAVTGPDAPAVLAAVEAVGANVLVLDPAQLTLFQLKKMVAGFFRGGVRVCPAELAERLT